MTVLNYFDRQKERLIFKGIACRVPFRRSAYEVLAEIDALKGLNTKERLAARNAAQSASRNKSTCLSSFQ